VPAGRWLAGRKLYKKPRIAERHRHRYEFNTAYRDQLERAGLVLSGVSPDGSLVEMIELRDHPWFLASQFHPEFKSRRWTATRCSRASSGGARAAQGQGGGAAARRAQDRQAAVTHGTARIGALTVAAARRCCSSPGPA